MGKLADDFITALHQLEETSDVDGITALFSDNAVLSNPLAVHDADDAVQNVLAAPPSSAS